MAKRTKSYGLNNPLQDVLPLPVVSTRNPTGNDKNYEIGQQWVNTAETRVYSLTSVTAGSATWALLAVGTSDLETLTGDSGGAISPDASSNINIVGNDLFTVVGAGNGLTVTETTGAYPITPFVVGAAGEAGYITIQAALDAANAAGGGTVYVQPGSFTENLTLYDQTFLVNSAYLGVGAGAAPVIITGVHIPPASGAVSLTGFRLVSATDIFNSAMAGSAQISVNGCVMAVTNGYTFNLPNWTGTINCNDSGSDGVNDGFVNNSGGASVFTNNGQYGAGTTQTFTANGDTRFDLSFIDCPVAISGGVIFHNIADFSQTMTLTGTAGGEIFLGNFFTGADVAIDHQSSGTLALANTVVGTSNDPAISGTGSIVLSGVFFEDNANLAAGLTVVNAATVVSDAFSTVDEASGMILSGTGISASGTDANISIGITPKGTGVVTSTTQIQAPSISFDSGTTSLDNYTEGSWTPALELGGGTTGITYASQNGNFVQVGNLVFLEGAFTLTSKGTDVGAATITGIPVANTASFRGIFTFQWEDVILTALYTQVGGFLINPGSTINLREYGDNVAGLNLDDTSLNNNSQIRFSGSYCVV